MTTSPGSSARTAVKAAEQTSSACAGVTPRWSATLVKSSARSILLVGMNLRWSSQRENIEAMASGTLLKRSVASPAVRRSESTHMTPLTAASTVNGAGSRALSATVRRTRLAVSRSRRLRSTRMRSPLSDVERAGSRAPQMSGSRVEDVDSSSFHRSATDVNAKRRPGALAGARPRGPRL